MQTYEKVYTTINQTGFTQVEHFQFNQLGVVCYTNNQIHVILQNWDDGMSIESVENECQIIRRLLMEIGANIWNSYYILCSTQDNIEDDLAFFIERSSASLRKYVIRLESDLNRVPFLDDIPVKKMDNPVFLTTRLTETDAIISTLLEEVKRLDGHTTSLNRQSIKDVVELILTNEGKTYEH
ncbi:hypothetical protein BK133_27180 [Paenibacillus sp. FSL H8-0548]|uniref:ABC-three component system middle component 1 n=1 Tax=Paenibacillus sp. FSL H8-0548 TaxID=1920422 RepID=UPI00096E8687|nr:ABC-three component system middle component 1 [Paenibacillus sp. FSL H8-0548]OMF22098.1 hypothetical protein BK133_27180 [Paenibacillus sp. FSL H8-0548]